MGQPVVTVATGGLPVVDVTSSLRGTPVTEAANGYGLRVTKVASGATPVVYETIGVAPPFVGAVLDAATASLVTLTVNNTFATNTGTTSANQGARVANASGRTSGKYYFELQLVQGGGGFNIGAGIGTIASTFTAMGGGAVVGVLLYNSANIWANNVNTGINLNAGSAFPGGGNFGAAVDLDNRKMWFRWVAGGNLWNGNAGNNPVTNVGGITIPAGTMVPFCTFGGTGGTANNSWRFNFGSTAFLDAVPSGFTAGWPA